MRSWKQKDEGTYKRSGHIIPGKPAGILTRNIGVIHASLVD
jgi:hypothetical protein